MTEENSSLRATLAATMSATLLLLSVSAYAQSTAPALSEPAFSPGSRFIEKSGEELFANVCQACHMPGATGAAGAGSYPSLSSNQNLEASGYLIHVVVNGRRGMPSFGKTMTDDQIAAVVNYVRTHFGNRYEDKVSAGDVRAARR